MTKVNSLEDKIKKYLDDCDTERLEYETERMAHDIAEICEKHYDLYDNLIADRDYAIEELLKEIKTHKQIFKQATKLLFLKDKDFFIKEKLK